ETDVETAKALVALALFGSPSCPFFLFFPLFPSSFSLFFFPPFPPSSSLFLFPLFPSSFLFSFPLLLLFFPFLPSFSFS
ncbi:hypothetical protein ACXWRW_11735, partial [Streptococcus pyogenes]